MASDEATEAMDFAYLEDFAAGDRQVIDEVLMLFRQEAATWSQALEGGGAWADLVHTIKGSARGIGAFPLGDACARAEAQGPSGLPAVAAALAAALAAIAAYQAAHEP